MYVCMMVGVYVVGHHHWGGKLHRMYKCVVLGMFLLSEQFADIAQTNNGTALQCHKMGALCCYKSATYWR